MIALYLAALQLGRALGRAFRAPETQAVLVATAIVIAAGTVFYALHEGWSVLDALYFTVMTLMTVGYGDLVPTTGLSKAFTMVYALIGIGLVASSIGAIAVAVAEQQRERIAARGQRTGRDAKGDGR